MIRCKTCNITLTAKERDIAVFAWRERAKERDIGSICTDCASFEAAMTAKEKADNEHQHRLE